MIIFQGTLTPSTAQETCVSEQRSCSIEVRGNVPSITQKESATSCRIVETEQRFKLTYHGQQDQC